ncbi:MAG TPA: pilus assembly protein [Anaerolineae bacterium]|nr:pilus assembly protein [Anaerolineae bacterium]
MHTGRLKGGQGQGLVEYALILPLLLLLLFGIVEFGWAVFAYNTVGNAAREVARCCVIPYPNATEPDQLSRCQIESQLAACEQAAVDHFSTAVQLVAGAGGSFSFSAPTVADPRVGIAVTYAHRLITGYIAGVLGLDPDTATFTLHTAATMRVE